MNAANLKTLTLAVVNLAAGTVVTDRVFRRLYQRTWWGGRKLIGVEILDAENAARIFRRTMKPYAMVENAASALRCECISYPFIEDGVPRIMVRMRGNAGTMRAVDCAKLRPIQFTPLITGVPANDPLPDATRHLRRAR